jgi:hypothetical protein|tara:strand:- start:69 stop:497 length:429 start_codon:yes stop_codon:yes gene_type:complete
MKTCNSCKTEKSVGDFGKRIASKDGLSAKCKVCQRVYDKARSKDKCREDARRIYAQTEEGRLTTSKAKAEYRKRNPIKAKAHAVVSRSIRSGNLVRKPCEKCSKEPTHAHHDDYSEPLNIRWLCDFHHNKWHKENGSGKNAE